MAKFRGDRPRDRGDLALKKKKKERKIDRKKETAAKRKGSRVTGGPNNASQSQTAGENLYRPYDSRLNSITGEKLIYLTQFCVQCFFSIERERESGILLEHCY